MIHGKRKHLGNFTDETEAARAYNEAAIKHVGEYANLNLIDEYMDVSEHVSEDVSEEESVPKS